MISTSRVESQSLTHASIDFGYYIESVFDIDVTSDAVILTLGYATLKINLPDWTLAWVIKQ